MYFLSGLPRSGSTVLAAILNQHPQLHVSSTSPLIDVMGAVAGAWEQNPSVTAQGRDVDGMVPLLRSLIQTHYADVPKSVILDKSRGWPAPPVMATMTKVLGERPKIVSTVRNLPDCAASFVRVAKPVDRKAFLRHSQLIQHLKTSYVTLSQGFAAAPENFCFVDYDELLSEPKANLARVLTFLELDPFDFDLSAISGTVVAERDEAAWGIAGLHDVKPVLKRQHSENSHDILEDMYTAFIQPEFWKPDDSPPAPFAIDLQKAANQKGDFAKGWEIAQQLEIITPHDDRAAFNRGWHVLAQGRLQAGMALLDRGRDEGIFGNPAPSGQPLWDGSNIRGKTILINLEGGLGDQIHAARWAKLLGQVKGAKVVLAGSPGLAPILIKIPGVSAFVESRAAGGVYHDVWYPGMSLVRVLGAGRPMEWGDLDGAPYIPCAPKSATERLRVGIRWAGNPRYEDDLHRTLPSEELFDLPGVDLISLQPEAGPEIPWHVECPDLSDWVKTKEVIEGLDLVITSCTSVAHLSAAMGKPTWIITPILPYYLWALPGNSTPWYDSVRLFRQDTFNDWTAPFAEVREALAATNLGGCCDAVGI